MRAVINQHYVFQVEELVEYPQILQIHGVAGSMTTLSIKPVLDHSLRIKCIQHWVSIGLITRCEDNDLIVFGQLFETFHGVWPDVEVLPPVCVATHTHASSDHISIVGGELHSVFIHLLALFCELSSA